MSPFGPAGTFLNCFFASLLAICLTFYISFLLSDVTATPATAPPPSAATSATTATRNAGEGLYQFATCTLSLDIPCPLFDSPTVEVTLPSAPGYVKTGSGSLHLPRNSGRRTCGGSR